MIDHYLAEYRSMKGRCVEIGLLKPRVETLPQRLGSTGNQGIRMLKKFGVGPVDIE